MAGWLDDYRAQHPLISSHLQQKRWYSKFNRRAILSWQPGSRQDMPSPLATGR